VLSAPLTVVLLVLGKNVPQLEFLEVLLGDEPVLTPDVIFYQRLLARDEDEASEIIRRQALTMSPVEVCDGVLVPTLAHARHDLQAGLLSNEEYDFVLSAVRLLADHEDLTAGADSNHKADDLIPTGRHVLSI